MEVLTLHCGDASATIYPAAGAAIGNWHWRGRDLLHVASLAHGPERMGCFPLLPYANRIAGGEVPGLGVLPPHPGERHSLHGVGWRRPWLIAERTSERAVLLLEHVADHDWPADFRAELTIALSEDTLTQSLELRNLGVASMPSGLGFHPYFPAPATATLAAQWEGRWLVGPDHIPSGFEPAHHSGAIEVAPWVVNNCFTGWNGQARLSYPDYALHMRTEPPAAFLQCYRPSRDCAFVALEPVTHIPNAHQLRLAGQADTGLIDLAPMQACRSAMILHAVAAC